VILNHRMRGNNRRSNNKLIIIFHSPKYMSYYRYSMVLIFLLVLNIYIFGIKFIGMFLLILIIALLAKWTSYVFFEGENIPLSFALSILFVIAWISIGESVLFFIKKLLLPYILIPILAVPILLLTLCILMNIERKFKVNYCRKKHISHCIDIKNSWNRVIISAFLTFLSSTVICYVMLFKARTSAVIAIVWEVIDPLFWIFFIISFISLLYILNQRNLDQHIKFFLCSIFTFEIFGMLIIVHEYMWGFDPWAHLAFLKKAYILGGLGSSAFSPTEYIGYRSLLVSIAKLSSLSVDDLYELHLLISPALCSVYIPYFTFLIATLFLNDYDRAWPAALGFVFFPLFMMCSISLPSNLAIVFSLATIYLTHIYIGKKRKKRLLLPLFSTSFAAFLMHELYGILAPTVILVALLYSIIKDKIRFKLLLKIHMQACSISIDTLQLLLSLLLLLASSLLIPFLLIARFHLYQLLYPKATTLVKVPYFKAVDSNSIISFFAPNLTSLKTIHPYYLWNNFKIFRYFMIACGGYILFKKKKKLASPYILSILAIYLMWFIIEVMMENIPWSHLQHRFGTMIDVLLAPIAGITICECINRRRKINKLIAILFVVIIASLAVYSGYDFDKLIKRHDPLRERVIPIEWINALEYIRNVTNNEKFVIVSDIYFGKFAAGYLGLRKSYPLGTLVHVNIGNEIDSYFHQITSNPFLFKQIMIKAMERTSSEIGFYVVDDYWIKIKKTITYEGIEWLKNISDEWKVFGDKSKVYVFKLRKPVSIPNGA